MARKDYWSIRASSSRSFSKRQ